MVIRGSLVPDGPDGVGAGQRRQGRPPPSSQNQASSPCMEAGKSETPPMRKPATGEPCAGEPHARFGGRGGESLPYPYRPTTTDQEICHRPMFVSHYHVASRSYCRLIRLIHRFRSVNPILGFLDLHDGAAIREKLSARSFLAIRFTKLGGPVPGGLGGNLSASLPMAVSTARRILIRRATASGSRGSGMLFRSGVWRSMSWAAASSFQVHRDEPLVADQQTVDLAVEVGNHIAFVDVGRGHRRKPPLYPPD